eukprot:CAMPEP_0178431792 /NCGR_PEP_ID=MMETSP0689_2-20121128/32044_1 /TAXON_ID=160604 /ORGANISM="Amphidinium massartii, Strain CS-259" /LENGTH=240 /DNA_ID=CAMNT_0020053743 /DNA_START=174 /DNA_END=893 /DNA_ORIENTATION=-
MGAALTFDQCALDKDKRVKECCHVEGETPVEIRIAHPPGGMSSIRMPGYTPRDRQGPWHHVDRELVPPLGPSTPAVCERHIGGSNWQSQALRHNDGAHDQRMAVQTPGSDKEFDPANFTTADADADAAGAMPRVPVPALRSLLVSHQLLAAADDSSFPEIIRASAQKRNRGHGRVQSRNSGTPPSELSTSGDMASTGEEDKVVRSLDMSQEHQDDEDGVVQHAVSDHEKPGQPQQASLVN